MPKQLLIYDQARPVSKTKHREWSVKTGDSYEFAKEINSVPVSAIEFPNAAREYAIVFTGKDDSIVPVVVLGMREDENLYLDSEYKFTSRYIPAFLRRYPFIFSSSDDGANFTLCIDESFAGCNQENIGERLFDSKGEQTVYLKNVLGFLKEYQVRFARTKAFCKKLSELELLEPMNAQINSPSGERAVLTGFLTVNRKKLKSLSGEQLESLIKTDEMELVYTHLQSLRNLDLLADKIKSREPQPVQS